MSLNEVHEGKHPSAPLVSDAATRKEVLRWLSMPAEQAGDAETGGGETEKRK